MRSLAMVVGLLLALPLTTPVAQAQNDWGLTRPGARRPGARRPGTGRPGARRPGGRRPEATAEGSSAQGRDRTEQLIQRYLRVLEADPRETFAFTRLLDLHRERDGNIEGLVLSLTARLAEDPEAFAPRMLLGHIYKAQGRTPEARAAYERASGIRPDALAPVLARAALARSADADAEARQLYERALPLVHEDSARQDVLRQLGEIALDQDDYDGAADYYGRISRGARGSVYLRTEFARALSGRNQHARAVAEYERVLRALRGDNRVLAPILRDMGRAQLDAGDTDGAIESLDRALRLAGRSAGVRAEIYDTVVEAYRRGDRLPDLVERLSHEGNGFEVLELRGRLHDELGNEAEALDAYRRALRMSPRHIDTRVRVIQLLSRSGRIDDVIVEYQALIRAAPREPRFVVELAQLHMQTGQRDRALALAEQTSRRYPREPAVHQALAEFYARWGEDERAAREVATLARIEPNDPAHLVALGAQQLEAGDRRAAVATWRRILSVDSDRARAHATLGGVYADHDMLEEAVQEYGEAVRIDADTLEYERGLANGLERLRRDDDAVTHWERVLTLAGDDRAARREARQRIVAIWQRARQLDERVRRFERAFSAEPPDVEAGRFLAEAHRRQGTSRAADAERVLERVVSLEPGDVESLLALERVRTAQGDLAGAIDVLQLLIDADSRRATRYLARMAEHALALYRDEDAVRYAAAAVERTPDDAEGHRRLGDLYRARQDMDQAVASYRRAIELNDRLFATYFDLAEIHVARGEPREADRLFRHVMRASPDDDLVSRATRASVQANLGAGTLEDLERDLLPLALGHPQRPVFRKLVVELYDALAGPLIQQARRPGPQRREAAERLRRMGTRALKPLLEALADSEPAQRRVAVDILGYLGNENAAVPLLAAAEGEGDATLRARALLAAGAVANQSLAPRFATLADGPERRLRAVAAWSLARMGGRQAVATMRDLSHQGDPTVRAFAVLGLGRAGDRSSAPRLGRLLREDRNLHVQASAAWALGRIGGPDHVPALVAALRGRSGIVAVAAASALGEIGDPSARDALAHALFDPDPAQREASARALRSIARDGGAGAEVDDRFPVPGASLGVGSYLATLLASEEIPEADPAVIARHRDALTEAATDALRGPVERVSAALEVLALPGPHLGLGPLTRGLAQWPEEARAAASEELAAMGRTLLPDLLLVVGHTDAAVRARAVRLLARVGQDEAMRAMVAALDDPEPLVQRAALESLGVFHPVADPRAGARVASLLAGHPDWSIRTIAAVTLGRLRAPSGLAALTAVLRDDDYAFVRESAARSLGELGDAGAVAGLSEALARDPEPRVRRASAAALRRIGGPAAARALEAAEE